MATTRTYSINTLSRGLPCFLRNIMDVIKRKLSNSIPLFLTWTMLHMPCMIITAASQLETSIIHGQHLHNWKTNIIVATVIRNQWLCHTLTKNRRLGPHWLAGAAILWKECNSDIIMYKSPLRQIFFPFKSLQTFVAFLIVYSEVVPIAEVPLSETVKGRGRDGCVCVRFLHLYSSIHLPFCQNSFISMSVIYVGR